MSRIVDSRKISATTAAKSISIAEPAEEGRPPGVLAKVLALAYCTFFVFLAVAGSVWILDDLSATLLPIHHVH